MPLVRAYLYNMVYSGRDVMSGSWSVRADNGTVQQTSSALVTVTIEDVNDNSPVITSVTPGSVLVSESAAMDYLLPVIVTVTDRDVGENAAVSY